MTAIRTEKTDILIIGAGGAGLFAALHAHKANPDLDITVAVKGLLGKSGCTRMVQGGYNVAIAKEDSVERHFMDTIEGGKWLNHQEIAWKLVNVAVERIHELENDLGCFFDRNPDGTIGVNPSRVLWDAQVAKAIELGENGRLDIAIGATNLFDKDWFVHSRGGFFGGGKVAGPPLQGYASVELQFNW